MLLMTEFDLSSIEITEDGCSPADATLNGTAVGSSMLFLRLTLTLTYVNAQIQTPPAAQTEAAIETKKGHVKLRWSDCLRRANKTPNHMSHWATA